MSFRQEVRLDQISPQVQGQILQLLLDHCKLRIVCKRQWLGAVPSYELERTDRPPAIVKEKVVDENLIPGESHGSEQPEAPAKDVQTQGTVRKSRRR